MLFVWASNLGEISLTVVWEACRVRVCLLEITQYIKLGMNFENHAFCFLIITVWDSFVVSFLLFLLFSFASLN